MHTRVAIIGAGPAGLLLAHLLHREGIECVVLEARSRRYVEQRQRAGILEQSTIDVLRSSGAGERMDAEGLVHRGLEFRFDRTAHRVDLAELTGGRAVMVYAQTEVVKDLIRLREEAGQPLLFEARVVALEGLETDTPAVRYEYQGAEQTLTADVVVGCDGFHGVARQSVPRGVLRTYERDYPFAWLGIMASVPPSCEDPIYVHHERGFALHSMRSNEVSRLYLQTDPGDEVSAWPDERIWDELDARFELDGDWRLNRGPITEKSITPMRSFVAEPMRYRRLFLAGDAAHIVPPTGAKGLNLAVSDVTLLAAALTHWYRSGAETGLDEYAEAALRRVWRAEHFSYFMTQMLHRDPRQDDFGYQLQLSQLRYTVTSRAAAASLAENYTGLWEA